MRLPLIGLAISLLSATPAHAEPPQAEAETTRWHHVLQGEAGVGTGYLDRDRGTLRWQAMIGARRELGVSRRTSVGLTAGALVNAGGPGLGGLVIAPGLWRDVNPRWRADASLNLLVMELSDPLFDLDYAGLGVAIGGSYAEQLSLRLHVNVLHFPALPHLGMEARNRVDVWLGAGLQQRLGWLVILPGALTLILYHATFSSS